MNQMIDFRSASKPATSFFIRGGTGVPDRSGEFVAECSGEAPVSFSEISSKVEEGVGVLDLSPSLVDFILLRRDPVVEAGLGVGVAGTPVAVKGPL